jgi:DNA-binding XRE family transcriptional regulator
VHEVQKTERRDEMNKQEIGRRLKALRIEKKMTQMDLSKELGIPQATIASYETGARMPMDETKVQLARFFGVTIDELFYAGTLA